MLKETTLDRLLRIAIFFILLCTIVDLLLLASLGLRYKASIAAQLSDPLDTLELRSSYVNLAELYSKAGVTSSKHDPIINHARAFVQVSSTEPHRIFPPYTHLTQLDDGFVPPYERRLLVTPTVSARWIYEVLFY